MVILLVIFVYFCDLIFDGDLDEDEVVLLLMIVDYLLV